MTKSSNGTEKVRRRRKVKPTPFVKWAGGKKQILSEIEANLPREFNKYIEPFLGGGAVYFNLYKKGLLSLDHQTHEKVITILSDTNERLIECYEAIRTNPDEVLSALEDLNSYRNEKDYYRLRDIEPEPATLIQRVALFIYFNKMCYNGLYRVNKSGQFNVPWGKRPKASLFDPDNIHDVSESLQNCNLLVSDFEEVLFNNATSNSFVYLDPPYHVPSTGNGFTEYTSKGFDEVDHIRLADAIIAASDRGSKILLSNSDTRLIRKLYPRKRGFYIEQVTAKRMIGCNPDSRRDTVEVLIRNYPGKETMQERLG